MSDASGPIRVRWLTPIGDAAIAVLELSGRGADQLLRAHLQPLAPTRRGSALPVGNVLRRGWLVDRHGEPIDEVLLRVVRAGAEPGYELCLHGGIETGWRALQTLRAAGAVLDADLARRPSLLEDEAHRAFLAARTEAAARFFLRERDSGTATVLRRWLADLPPLAVLRQELDPSRRRYRAARALLEPPRVVLVGAVNAGKSSLLNALARTERAIVSPLEGTTRDPLRAELLLAGRVVEVWDTAGYLPHVASAVDRAAWDLTLALVERADLILEIVDLSRAEREGPPLCGQVPRRVIGAKADLPRRLALPTDLTCSSHSRDGVAELEALIVTALGLEGAQALASPAPFLPRHVAAIDEAMAAGREREFAAALRHWLAPNPAHGTAADTGS